MKPTVGRTVHYVARGSLDGRFPSVCRAAIVTQVDQYQPSSDDAKFIGHADLAVLNPGGLFFDRGVHFHGGDPAKTGPVEAGHSLCERNERAYPGGTWHWPERVD